MLALRPLTPSEPAPPPPGGDGSEEAVRRAHAAAGVSEATCRFHSLGPQVEALLAPLRPAAARGMILVACPDRHRERCLTAAQRFMLSLAWDGVRNAWVGTGLPDGDAFRAAGVDLGADAPVGLIWWG